MELHDPEELNTSSVDFNEPTESQTAQLEGSQDSSSLIEEVLPEKYKGKSVSDIVKMHQEAEKMIGRQAQEVGEVRKLADDLIKSTLVSKQQPQIESEPEVDFFEDPQKAIRNTVDRHPDVLAAKQASQEFKRMTIQQKLAATHPDFTQIVQDQGFAEWVKASPVRLGLYAKADGEYDFDSANELLSTYKELRGRKNANTNTKAVQPSLSQEHKQAIRSVSMDTGGTGEVSKKIYRRSDLIRLKMTDPDRYNDLQPEIMKAYSEGRVK